MSIGQRISKLEVRTLRKSEYEEWNSLVEKSPQGTIFHKTSWLSSFDDNQFSTIVCTYKRNIVGGIPLPFKKRYGLKFAVNPPFTPYLGLIFRENYQKYTNRLSFEKRVARLVAEKIKNFAPYTKYSFHYNFVDAQPFIWAGFSVKPRYTYVLNLKEPLDMILRNMEKSTRNRIVKASKYNLEFFDATPNEMVELTFLTYKRKNQKPPYSRQTYEKYIDIFSKNKAMKALIIKDKNDLIAGGIIISDSNRSYYLIGGINPKSSYNGMGQLVMWNLIRYAKNTLDLKEFDFEGSMNENIEPFLRGFGGKLTQYYSIYKENTMHYLTTVSKKVRLRIKM